jgi:hypothetical protein
MLFFDITCFLKLYVHTPAIQFRSQAGTASIYFVCIPLRFESVSAEILRYMKPLIYLLIYMCILYCPILPEGNGIKFHLKKNVHTQLT